ncbi:MAG: T9SS type A sorting domain-containing protein [Bacteroidetes bacterium]|nr:T9SS type A sorting domain-containing protein [Bacteroidota bacterium]
MKTTILTLLSLLLTAALSLQAQEFRGAEIDLFVSNGADRSAYLVLGVREGCTDGLDMAYEEYELPPMPPNEIFDVRVVSTPGQSQLGLGSYRDYRDVKSTTSPFTLNYTIAWQCGVGSTGIEVTWPDPYPARITSMVIDGVDMNGKQSWSSSFPQGQVTVEVRFNYVPLTFSATPASINFNVNNKDPLPYVDVQIVTEGDANAAWTLQYDAPWLYVNPTSGNGAGTIRVSVISSSEPAGNYSTTLELRSPVYGAQLDIPVTMSMTVGINDPPIPGEPYLHRSYPNPFTEQTVLQLQLGSAANRPLSLRIYDALGRQVADLSARVQHTGAVQAVPFHAAELPPGTYTCRLTVDGNVFTTSMLLLK